MMMTNNFNWLPFGWHLYSLSFVILLIGIILFLRWAFIALDKKSLIRWTLWFLIIGVLGLFLTSGWGFSGMQYMHGSNSDGSFWNHMMYDDEHEDINTPEELRDHMIEEMDEHMGF